MLRNRLFQQCLASALRSTDTLEVLELEHEDEGLLDYLRTEKPDMALIDLGLPGNTGILLTQFINECNWDIKAIVIVSAFSQDRIVECIAAGAHAWLHEESSMDELRQAINDVREGRVFYSSTVVHSLFGKFAQLAQDDRGRQRARSTSLTQRELKILDLISQRLTNKEIAKQLCVSLYTIKNHVHNILEKLQLHSRHDAVEYARDRYWLSRF